MFISFSGITRTTMHFKEECNPYHFFMQRGQNH